MPDIRNDEPINSVVNDLFGFSFQASVIAKLVGGKDSHNHLSVGVSGSWGSGKTSLLYMVRELLEYIKHEESFNALKRKLGKNKIKNISTLRKMVPFYRLRKEIEKKEHLKDIPSSLKDVKVIWFDPWFFGSEETVIKAFFYRIAKELMDEDKELAKLFLKLAVVMSSSPNLPESLPVVGDAFKVINYGRNLLASMSGDDGSVMDFTDIKNKITAKLGETKKRIVIIIDDLDRLQVDEALTMLKVIRLVTEFGVNFVIGYDEETLSATIDKNCGGHGREYIRKMINIPVSISAISDGDYQKFIEKNIHPKAGFNRLCNNYLKRYDVVEKILKDETTNERLENNVFNVPPSLPILFQSLAALPREIINISNLYNAFSNVFDAKIDELDFLLLCIIKIAYPKLYNLLHEKEWPFKMNQNTDEVEFIKEDEKKVFEKTTKHDQSSDAIIEKTVKRSLDNQYYDLFPNAISEGIFSSMVYLLLSNNADNAFKRRSNFRFYFCFLPKDYEDNEKSLENLYNSQIGLLNDPIYQGLHLKAQKPT